MTEPVPRKPSKSVAARPIKPKPRYSEVADQIRLHIMTGRYGIGSLLPSETELRQQFNVSRHTVREAIRQLQIDGLVSPEQGRGTRVDSNQDKPHLSVVLGSLDGIARYGRATHLVNLRSKMIVADEALASNLHCQVGEELLYIQSYREPRDDSLSLARAWNETYILGRFASIRDEIETWSGAVYSLIEQRFGERIVSIRQEASALNLDAKLAKRLDVKPGTAGLQVKRTYFSANGVPLLFGFNTYEASKFTLVMDIKRHEQD
ncbi:MAG: GntR family transcriptional regulator [Pseudomonadota bacterium]